MPELPDVAAYISALEPRILGEKLERINVASVALLRSTDPPLTEAQGRTVRTAASRARQGWPSRPRCGRHRRLQQRSRGIQTRARCRKPYAQTRAGRSARAQRHRQRIFGRN
ncbi:MAG: DNA-formamidopyrimidine glycosylase family protein, partial [Vulcanimicrobiaceae bacterium]